MSQINPPPSDELLDRHRFYSAVATTLAHEKAASDASIQTRNRLHTRVDEVGTLAKNTAEALTEIKTQARTIASVVGALWLALGGLVGWSLDKTVTKLDNYIAIIDKDQRKIESLEKEIAALQSQKESVDALKRVVSTLQTDLADVQAKGRGK